MKTIDEKIRRYIEGEMTVDELSAFEKEIESSAELKKVVENLQSTLKIYRELGSVKAETNYFNNIIPEFRRGISKKRKAGFFPAYSFGSFIIIFVTSIIILLISISDPGVNPDDGISEDIMNEEIEQFLADYSSDYSYLNFSNGTTGEMLDSLFTSELNLTAGNLDLQFDFANTKVFNRRTYESINNYLICSYAVIYHSKPASERKVQRTSE
jgi:hypothetical protein